MTSFRVSLVLVATAVLVATTNVRASPLLGGVLDTADGILGTNLFGRRPYYHRAGYYAGVGDVDFGPQNSMGVPATPLSCPPGTYPARASIGGPYCRDDAFEESLVPPKG